MINNQSIQVREALKTNQAGFHTLIDLNPDEDRILKFNLTSFNPDLTAEIFNEINSFRQFVKIHMEKANARYAIGGYNEYRDIYSRSTVFDSSDSGTEPRRRHLGLDIWADAGTPVYCPLNGIVHSVGRNMADGDYGATLILHHELKGLSFYTLYGHLSLADLNVQPGTAIDAGDEFCHFGIPAENGNWPPHLHFQIIIDLQNKKGDYPGVCSEPDKQFYLDNCPDPDLIACLQQYAVSCY